MSSLLRQKRLTYVHRLAFSSWPAEKIAAFYLVGYFIPKTLGGPPQTLAMGDYPICPSCQQRMSFYAQIDSIGDQFDLADGMVIHNFVCFDCLEVKAMLSQVSA